MRNVSSGPPPLAELYQQISSTCNHADGKHNFSEKVIDKIDSFNGNKSKAEETTSEEGLLSVGGDPATSSMLAPSTDHNNSEELNLKIFFPVLL